jgi:DNA-binding CsgD family transcriptional regulator
MRLGREIAGLAALAAEVGTREELRRETLRRLDGVVGFDFGVVWRPGETTATLTGFDENIWRTYAARAETYRPDVEILVAAALAQRGVTRDVVALDARRRDASPFYAEIIRPAGSAGYLTAVLGWHGQAAAMIQLGRGGRAGWAYRERDADRLRALAPVLALGEAAHAPRPPSPPQRAGLLTPREAEVLRYVVLGFTNREVALACGTSPHTVRNQLASIFVKAEVSTRAELVAWALGGP